MITSISIQPVEIEPTVAELATALLTVLAEIRCVPLAELEAERAAGGDDLEIASPEAVAVVATLQGRYGRRLARVEDLEPEQLTSVANLTALIHRRWPATALVQTRSES